jgi:hypothetical protein
MFGCKNKRKAEQQSLSNDDAGTCGTIDEKANVNACATRQNRNHNGNDEHVIESICQQSGGAAGSHEHGDHEQNTHGLKRGNNGGGKHGEKEVMKSVGIQTERPRVSRIEAVKQQVFAQWEEDE